MHTFTRWVLSKFVQQGGGWGWERMEGEGWISVVLPDVIKTGPCTNNFTGICCLQSSLPAGLKLRRELQTYLIFSSKM